ncbi:MAG: 3-deoxy-7-phosphoheptulonate synthase [Oscillospiraceae bacterium]
MIIVLKPNSDKNKVNALIEGIKSQGLMIEYMEREDKRIFGIIGDTTKIDDEDIKGNSEVESVHRVSEPYKMSNRRFHPTDTIVKVGDKKIGEGFFNVIAGPCSVESEEQLCEIAEAVKKSGANFLRGGAFKPRTSPYAFQGMRNEGIELLLKAKKLTGLSIVTEIMDLSQLNLFADVDIIQVGARNMQNFELLKELGHCNKPILLKRGLANTIDELLMSAEYVMSGGNSNVILCERGIRTFETSMRNTLDISAIPMIKQKSHLPVIIDPSHAAGIRWMVRPLSKAAVAVGADGLMIEVHNNPEKALCDGAQSLTPDQFDDIMKEIKKLAEFGGRIL